MNEEMSKYHPSTAADELLPRMKDEDEFRVYEESTSPTRVVEHYRDMRTNQTVRFYERMEAKYSFENGTYRSLMTMEEALEKLDGYVVSKSVSLLVLFVLVLLKTPRAPGAQPPPLPYLPSVRCVFDRRLSRTTTKDASDPDLDLPNWLHLVQTAEGIRRAGHPDWLQLTGLLHDVGKIMFLWGTGEDGQDGRNADGKQWGLAGDTWVVGCKIPDGDDVVFSQFNDLNPDMHDDRYNTQFGVYEPHCGLDELKFAWGHDEYMYRMLVANNSTIPREGLDMIRFHSAYPLHEKGAYRHLLLGRDDERIEWVRLFNKFDLYTKDYGGVDGESSSSDDNCDRKGANRNDRLLESWRGELWPYYRGLLEKYGLGGKLRW